MLRVQGYLCALAMIVGLATALQAATVSTSGGGLIVVGDGRSFPGATVQSNLATAGGSVPLALDQLGFGIHLTVNINDGLYGNSESWIGNGATGFSGPYAGVGFAGSNQINRIAFGRDSLGSSNDRSLGAYTLQYRNDGSTADDAGWSTVGTITYGGAQNPPTINSGHRHEFRFNPVNATAVRLIVPATGIGAGTAIDEFEVFAGSAAPPAPLVVSAPGGSYGANNVALNSNLAIAFAQDELGAFPHNIPNLNNGTYGNGSSWIGNNVFGQTSYAGVNLNGQYTISAIGFSRDNTGGFADRAQGAYTLQYTTAANPGTGTPDSAWNSIGLAEVGPVSAGLRRTYSFSPISGVTGVRVITGSGDLAIDELEVQGTGISTFALGAVGVHSTANVVPNNLALVVNGGESFAKDVINFPSRHAIPGINDGNYGNSKSWIGNSANSFIGIDLNNNYLFNITGVAWGRDNGGDESPDFAAASAFTDRALGLYTLQYTTSANPDETTPDSSWITIGLLNYDGSIASPATRHLWNLNFPVQATGLRLLVPNGAAIDEFEVFGSPVPEPGTVAIWTLMGVVGGIAAWRKRRKMTNA